MSPASRTPRRSPRVGQRPQTRQHSQTQQRSQGKQRPGTQQRPQPRPATRIEFLFLPGLAEVVAAEIRDRLPGAGPVQEVTGRSDSLAVEYAGEWERLLEVRTIVAPFLVLNFAVPRPRSLTSGEYFPQIMEAVRLVQRINAEPPDSFRIDAAGRESAGYQRLAAQLAAATGLRQVDEDGQLLLRFRRAAGPDEGWDVLVRLSSRPLSSRPWRVSNLPGAANATIAAAMSRLTSPRPGDRVANLMCGSGTLLIERLLAGPARVAVGLDSDADAVSSCSENLAAAGLRDRVTLLQGDIGDPEWTRLGPFDVIVADPPWGTLMGDHATNEALHTALLDRAHAAAAPRARLVVLTHEVRMMERCLRQAADHWAEQDVVRVFQKGHYPRIYVLTKR
jgi:predicted RNA methylase